MPGAWGKWGFSSASSIVAPFQDPLGAAPHHVAHGGHVGSDGAVPKGNQGLGFAPHFVDSAPGCLRWPRLLPPGTHPHLRDTPSGRSRRAVDHIHQVGQVNQKLIQVQKGHVAARTPRQPDGGKLYLVH